MLNRLHLLTAVCLAAMAGLFVANPARADDPLKELPVAMTDNALVLPAGITAKDLNADKSIEKAFKAITEDAMDKTGLDNLVGKFVDQDRERIKKSLVSGSLNNIDGSKNRALTDLIADIEGSWKSKYNQNFSLDYTKVLTPAFVHIQTGEVADPLLLVGKWPIDPMFMADGAGKVTQADADLARSKTFGGDVNLEKGRNVAIAHLMNSGNVGGLNVSLIHEAGGWKFDVPNTLTAQKLYSNLVANLTYVDQHKDQWPADVNEAYRHVTHAVVTAAYDVPMNHDTGTVINR